MIPIAGQPFLHYQLKWLARNHIRNVILSTGHFGEQIHDFVGNGEKWDLNIQCIHEGSELRGTGGALRWVYDQGILENEFLMTYGDSFLPVNYLEVWQRFQASQKPALMTLLNNENQWDASNACFDGENVTLYDKKYSPSNRPPAMHYIDYGLSAWKTSQIAAIPPKTRHDVADLFHSLSLSGGLAGFEVRERFYEIGSIHGIQDFETYIAAHPI